MRMVLVDSEVRSLIDSGSLSISPFNAASLTSNGYDLLVEDFSIGPGEHVVVSSVEKVCLPSNLVALPFLRTTYAFRGLFLSPGVVDAGFEGRLRFSLFNASKEAIRLEERDDLKRAVHLIFLKSDVAASLPFGLRFDEENNVQ